MPDMLATASLWLDNTLKTSVSQTVRYRRGAAYVDVLASFGITGDQEKNSPESQRVWQATDFLITAADLVLGGHVEEPQKGDKIEFLTSTFEVLPDEITGRCFGYCDDSTKSMLRVHTKEIG